MRGIFDLKNTFTLEVNQEEINIDFGSYARYIKV